MLRIAALAFVVACASSSSTPVNKNGSGSAPTPKDTAMTQDRASIYPADQLLAWLEQHVSDEIVIELPVLVTLKPNRMYIKTATVGDQPDALAVKINDTGMGVPIAGKFSQFCGEGVDTCMLLLRGAWRGGANKEFQVSSVVRAVPEADRAGAVSAVIVK